MRGSRLSYFRQVVLELGPHVYLWVEANSANPKISMIAHRIIYGILSCAFLLLPFESLAQTDVNEGFTYKGLSRSYTVHLPPDTSISNIPVVFNLHFFSSNGFQQQIYSRFDSVADTANIIVVYPDGFGGVWDTIFQNSPVDDIGFISAIIDSLVLDYNIDTNRIYSIGMSMGGFMTYRLACELGERIAAIASVGGPLTEEVFALCDNAPLTPLMHIHGSADSTIPFAGDVFYPSVDTTIAYFVQRNACLATPLTTTFPDIDTSDSSTVVKSYYGLCYDSIEVILYTILNGGHTWPGTFPFPALGHTNQDINASVEIWNFLKKYKLNTNTVVVGKEAYTGRNTELSIFPNPSTGLLHLQMSLPEQETVKLSVFNILGQEIYASQSVHHAGSYQSNIDLQNYPAGLYLLQIHISAGILTKQLILE